LECPRRSCCFFFFFFISASLFAFRRMAFKLRYSRSITLSSRAIAADATTLFFPPSPVNVCVSGGRDLFPFFFLNVWLFFSFFFYYSLRHVYCGIPFSPVGGVCACPH
jgi:hypothetical protein